MAVQSIERAFTLLRTIAQYPDGISVSDLARSTELHKSTVSRLVLALEAEQAIQRLSNNNHLQIGEGLAALIASATYPQNLVSLIRPHLYQLSDAIGEAVGLGIPDGNHVSYIDQVPSKHAIQVRYGTGERFPLHVTASGKLFLAYGLPHKLEQYLTRPLVSYTDKTITEPELLRQHLSKIRQQGYDWAADEFEDGLVAVASPVFNHQAEIVASIYICGPHFRFPAGGEKKRVTRQLRSTCQEITNLLNTQERAKGKKRILMKENQMSLLMPEAKRWLGSEWLKNHPKILEKVYDSSKSVLKFLYPFMNRISPSFTQKFMILNEEVVKGYIFNCQMCGQCILHSTGMTCPMNCPKNLRNGPCGGVRANGHCEVIPEMPCVWVQAWERSGQMGMYGDEIQMVQPPVNRQLKDTSAWINMFEEIDQKPQSGWVPLSELEK